MTDNLDSAATQRLETFASREKQLDALGDRAQGISRRHRIGDHRGAFGPQLGDDDAGRAEGSAHGGADGRHAVHLMSDSNLMSGALSAAAAATRSNAIDDADKTFKATRKRMTENAEIVRESVHRTADQGAPCPS